MGLLETVFPGMTFRLDRPEDFSEKKEKRLAVAWILRNNDPEDVKDMLLHGTWSKQEVNDIVHLIKMRHWGSKHEKDDSFFGGFFDMKKELHGKTSLVPSMLRKWGEMTKLDPEMVDHYSKHELSTKGMVPHPHFAGFRNVNPELTKLFGRTPKGQEFHHGIKHLETEKFRDRFSKNR